MIFLCAQSFALDCLRPVKKLWSGFDNNRIYVIHGDGYSNSGMSLDSVNQDEAVVNRTLSMIMSGAVAGKTITFRYQSTQDGSPVSCTPSAQQNFIGAWIEF